jgi:hypothetical protein
LRWGRKVSLNSDGEVFYNSITGIPQKRMEFKIKIYLVAKEKVFKIKMFIGLSQGRVKWRVNGSVVFKSPVDMIIIFYGG